MSDIERIATAVSSMCETEYTAYLSEDVNSLGSSLCIYFGARSPCKVAELLRSYDSSDEVNIETAVLVRAHAHVSVSDIADGDDSIVESARTVIHRAHVDWIRSARGLILAALAVTHDLSNVLEDELH